MEEKNNKKVKLLYTLLGIALLLTLVGGAYAFFSASVSNSGTIGGQTQNINNDSLTLTVKKVVFTGASAPSNDLVPAWFGYSSGTNLNVVDPSALTEAKVGTMLTNKCVSDGFTGCHVYQIKIKANQNITHANLLLNLSVGNLTGAANVVDKSQWGYVVFSATGDVDSSTGATDGLSTPVFNTNNGAPAAIGNGVTNLDIHNDSSLSTTEVIYYLLVYVNDTGESQNSVSSNTGDNHYAVGTYSGSLELQALGGKVRVDFGPQIAAQYVTNLYTSATKSATPATVNNIQYNYAPIFDNDNDNTTSGGLMNDRHGSSSVGANAGDIRYYGANPNNYVTFNDELWRIIGVFDGRLKLIRENSIGEYSWDTSAYNVNSGYGVNEWSQADLMKLLNPGYSDNSGTFVDESEEVTDITVNNSLYWNKDIGNVYVGAENAITGDVSFEYDGLSENAQDMIDTVTWYLGATMHTNLYVNQMYNAERQSSILGCSYNCSDNVVRTAAWNGKVGLMYASDYGYAADLSQCDYTLDNYNNCNSNNWLIDTENWQWTWTITPHISSSSADPNGALTVGGAGILSDYITSYALYVRPVVYLKSGVTIDTIGKDGSQSHPYVLSLS